VLNSMPTRRAQRGISVTVHNNCGGIIKRHRRQKRNAPDGQGACVCRRRQDSLDDIHNHFRDDGVIRQIFKLCIRIEINSGSRTSQNIEVVDTNNGERAVRLRSILALVLHNTGVANCGPFSSGSRYGLGKHSGGQKERSKTCEQIFQFHSIFLVVNPGPFTGRGG